MITSNISKATTRSFTLTIEDDDLELILIAIDSYIQMGNPENGWVDQEKLRKSQGLLAEFYNLLSEVQET